jgi:RNA polymerase sigma-70 factor (ECF subfamily)
VVRSDEERWVQLAQHGDRQAFAVLADRYWTRVFRWLCGLTHHTQVAEDLTQDAFLKAWQALPSLATPSTFRPWLFCIARHSWINSKRGPRGIPVQPLPAAASAKDSVPLASVLEQEGQELLRGACTRLPEHFRAPFLLWTYEGLPYDELAQVLDITEETARWRVCKARQLLLRELAGYLDEKMS